MIKIKLWSIYHEFMCKCGRHVWINRPSIPEGSVCFWCGKEADDDYDKLYRLVELAEKDATIGETEDRLNWALNKIDEKDEKITQLEMACKAMLPVIQYILANGWDEAPPLLGTTFDEVKANELAVTALAQVKEE